jgi:predicted metal-dependent phosphoesterase TrpH
MNSALIDMHVHTSASDGTMAPAEVVSLAARSGLKAVAITDHDTVDGLAEAQAAGAKEGLEVVPGIEISVDYNGEMHILGYYIDPQNHDLRQGLADLRRYRDERNPQMIKKLRALNFDITLEEVARAAGDGVSGRPHFARVMLQKGWVHSFDEAFDRYLGIGQPAYVKKEKLTPAEGIALVAKAGGIPVLAHPKYLKIKGRNGLAGLLPELMEYGLQLSLIHI